MNELSCEINELVAILSTLTIDVTEGDYRTYEQDLGNFAQKMMTVFPRIIETYSRPEFANVAEDAKYWSAQLERLVTVLQQRDQFLFVDVLFFETRQNLLLFCEMIEGMEIS